MTILYTGISVIPKKVFSYQIFSYLKKSVLLLGKKKIPNSLLTDESCEVLAFQYLFPTGKFGYNIQPTYKLSPIKYFNQRLLNYTQVFAFEADYIFYVLSVMLYLAAKA